MDSEIKASAIAEFLGQQLLGPDLVITSVRPLASLCEGALGFAKVASNLPFVDFNCLVIAPEGAGGLDLGRMSIIEHENPRLAYSKAVAAFLVPPRSCRIDPTAIIDESVELADGVSIGPYCVLGAAVRVGTGTVLNSHVVVASNTVIGENCYIKSGSIIGEEGFGFERDPRGVPVRMPQLGRVVIGNNVEIGAKATICRGAISDTVICDNVKIDDQVHLAHNCIVEENVLITACAEISGGVHIGRNCWISPNASIIQKVDVGDGSLVGIGAVVIAKVRPDTVVFGNPAKFLRENDR